MSDIFGYSWEDIQRAQRGGRLGRSIQPAAKDDGIRLEADRALLAKHGADGLKTLGYAGVIDAARGAT